ncbi:MAG TPA: SDR family oxidoreductase [Nitrososphaera sp.]|jgi:NAD(P)-dependent dehydrogenase (short-subunit alcohol dehydrogenase family)|nr:SDR family oxidoreductase [Nitrososphaera sp.]
MIKNSSKKVAVVTGSCKSIGQAIALEFAKEGYCVAINGVDKSALDNAVKNIAREISGKDEDPRIISLVGDISSGEIAESLVEQTIKKYGRIDVLINNLELLGDPQRVNSTNKIGIEKPVSPYFTLEEFEFSDNSLIGAYISTREVAKWMSDNDTINNNYSIINVSYCPDCIPSSRDPFTSSRSGIDLYTSSRESTKILTKSTALELGKIGIRVNGIVPGIIFPNEGERYGSATSTNNNNNDWEKDMIPIKRIGQPREVAQVATFLASTKASYVTGTLVYVDGGLALNRPARFLEQNLEVD